MFKFNIFGKRTSDIKLAEATKGKSDTSNHIPPVDLFIDNTPPNKEPEKQHDGSAPTKLSRFLERDYFSIGKRDGYLYHSQETLELWKKKTKAEFQMTMDHMIQEKNEQHLKLLNHLVSIGNIHESTSSQLKNTLDELKVSIEQLVKQKELSVDDEGWIMSAIHTFHQGFTQGVNDYIEGEVLLKNFRNI